MSRHARTSTLAAAVTLAVLFTLGWTAVGQAQDPRNAEPLLPPPWEQLGDAWVTLPAQQQQALQYRWVQERDHQEALRRARSASAGSGASPQTAFATASSGAATWEQIGPEGGDVIDIAFHPTDPSRVFGATRGGFVQSTDGGQTWSRLVVETNPVGWYGGATIRFSPADPSMVYAGTQSYLYTSTDGGSTWSERSMLIGDQWYDSRFLALDPADANKIYRMARTWDSSIGSYNGVVLRSADAGVTWDIVPLFSVDSYCGYDDRIAVDPTDGSIYAATARCGTHQTILYKSSDGGVTWAEVYASPGSYWSWGARGLVIDGAGNVFVAGDFNDNPYISLIRSLDGGATWEDVVTPEWVGAMAAGSLYFTNGRDVYRSSDNGDTWTELGDLFVGNTYWPETMAVDPNDPQRLIAGVDSRGFFQTQDGGSTWAPSNGGLHVVTPEDVYMDPSDPNTIWMAAGALWHTTDGGATWGIVPDVGGASYLAADPTDADILYAKDCCSTLYRSTDGGASWQQIYLWDVVGNANFRGMTVDPDGVLFISGQRWDVSRAFFMASHDHGDSWDSWLLSTNGEPANLLAPGNGRVYTALWDGDASLPVVHSTTTQGTDEFRGWFDPETTYGYCCNWAIEASPSGLIYVGGNTYLNGYGHSLWVSGDGTGTFSPLRQTQEGEAVRAIAIDPSESAIFIAGGFSGSRPAVLSSTDGGATWQIEVDGPADGTALALLDDGTELTVLAGIQAGGLLASVQPSFGSPVTPGLPPPPTISNITVDLLGPDSYDAVPANFPIPVSLTATNLAGVRVIKIILDVGTQSHFDLNGVTYAPPSGFSVLSIDPSFDRVTVTATTLGAGLSGDADLGTINVPTASSFTETTEAALRVRSVALGGGLDDLEYLLESQIGIEITLNIPRILANSAPVGPTIDGVLNGPEWAGAQPLFVEFSSPNVPPGIDPGVAGPPADDNDLSYTVYTLYTATDLFIGVDIVDDQIRTGESETWQNDDVELFIDGDLVANDISTDWGNGNKEGFQIAIDAGGQKLGNGLTAGLDWDAQSQTTATGWSAEFQIPLASIDVTDGAAGEDPPGRGAMIGFNIVVYDDDSATGFYVPGEDTYGKWVGFGASNNEADWGELFLSDIPPPPPILPLLIENPLSNCGGPLPVDALPDPLVDCGLLEAGFADGATDSRDPQWDEVEQPPLPPSGVFDARFSAAGLNGLLRDLRAFPAAEVTEVVWSINLQAGTGGYPLTVSWDPAKLSLFSGTWTLSDAFGGVLFSVNLNTDPDGVFQITNPAVTAASLTYRTGSAGECNYSLPAGWSMISICGEPTSGDATLATNFPDAISLFRFAGGYQTATELAVGQGYWINMPAIAEVTVAVNPATQVALDLPAGWSMVGGPASSVAVDGVKAAYANVISVFGFAGGYFTATSFEPSEGYWINMASAGGVNLPPPAAKPAPALARVETFTGGMLWARSGDWRQEIQLGVAPEAIIELPPVPPAGVLDARAMVGDGNGSWQVPLSAGPMDYALVVQGPQVELGWAVPAAQGDLWELVLGDVSVPLTGMGAIDLGTQDPTAQLTLRQVNGLPSAFRLTQNYPNPFNPATTIRYDLKATGPVSLAVYDITGQLVRQLVAGDQPAGRYTVTWDGANAAATPVASGVYLYELRAGSFRSVHKMLLMK